MKNKRSCLRKVIIVLCVIAFAFICYSIFFCVLSYQIVKNINSTKSYDEFKSSQYSQYIKDEEYYNQMHFSGDRADTDTSYYGVYVAIPVWNEVVVYHYYIYDVRDANGKIVSGGGSLFEPCRTKITYKYEGVSLVVDKAYEQIAYE